MQNAAQQMQAEQRKLEDEVKSLEIHGKHATVKEIDLEIELEVAREQIKDAEDRTKVALAGRGLEQHIDDLASKLEHIANQANENSTIVTLSAENIDMKRQLDRYKAEKDELSRKNKEFNTKVDALEAEKQRSDTTDIFGGSTQHDTQRSFEQAGQGGRSSFGSGGLLGQPSQLFGSTQGGSQSQAFPSTQGGSTVQPPAFGSALGGLTARPFTSTQGGHSVQPLGFGSTQGGPAAQPQGYLPTHGALSGRQAFGSTQESPSTQPQPFGSAQAPLRPQILPSTFAPLGASTASLLSQAAARSTLNLPGTGAEESQAEIRRS